MHMQFSKHLKLIPLFFRSRVRERRLTMYLRTLVDFFPVSGLPAYRLARRNRADYTLCRFTVRSLPVFALWWVLAANHANAATISAFSGDGNNTSTTGGYPGIFYNCPWITAGEQSFMAANPGWNFTYAGAAASAFLQNDLSVVSYYPWVVNQPTYSRTFTNPDGTTTTRTWGGNLNGEAGGAYIQLAYTPHGTDPVNIRWIQGVNANYYGRGFDGGHLDNPGDRTSPFYDVGSQDLAGSTYFVDIPGAPENEYEGNPVANVNF